MTEQLYRIKPLEWRYHGHKKYWKAKTVIGDFYADATRWEFFLWDDDIPSRDEDAQDEEQAKAAAEAHYRERMMGALEPVTLKCPYNYKSCDGGASDDQ